MCRLKTVELQAFFDLHAGENLSLRALKSKTLTKQLAV